MMKTWDKVKRTAIFGEAYLTLVRDPNQLEKVFKMFDALLTPELLETLASDFRRDEKGRLAMERRPRVNLDLARLRKFPDGSLGREHARNMDRYRLDPAALPSLPSPDPLSFVNAHLYETHDLWHTVTGFGVDVIGELGLQGFYVAQFPGQLSLCILSAGLMNTALFKMDERTARMDAIVTGFAMGKKAKPLFGTDWESLWAEPLGQVRRSLEVDALSERRADAEPRSPFASGEFV